MKLPQFTIRRVLLLMVVLGVMWGVPGSMSRITGLSESRSSHILTFVIAVGLLTIAAVRLITAKQRPGLWQFAALMVGIVCFGWLFWQRDYVLQRHDKVLSLIHDHNRVDLGEMELSWRTNENQTVATIPWWRYVLGDKPYEALILPYGPEDERTKQGLWLFPETRLSGPNATPTELK